MNKIIDYYNNYVENGKLFCDYSHHIEQLTTIYYFDKPISDNSKIFNGCAGTVNYAFKQAEQSHNVVASDIVPHNVDIIIEKQNKNTMLKNIFVGDIYDNNHYDNNYFDIVLYIGAFYHLNENMRYKGMEHCLRFLKATGILINSHILLTM